MEQSIQSPTQSQVKSLILEILIQRPAVTVQIMEKTPSALKVVSQTCQDAQTLQLVTSTLQLL